VCHRHFARVKPGVFSISTRPQATFWQEVVERGNVFMKRGLLVEFWLRPLAD
jgi:hypothetical protein